MLYVYDQNNSGGYFIDPAILVVVDADSPEEADSLALENGVYFNSSADCECCGPRWSSQSGGYPDIAESVEELNERVKANASWAEESKIPLVLSIVRSEQ